MRILFHILVFLLFFQAAFAQEMPLNSQIFLNPYYYNPAYAGFEDRPAFYVYRRQQWTGIEGAPVTTGFNFHTIFNEKVNFGVHIQSDERAILNTTRALLTIGYRASFDEFHYLSFGLSGGVGFNNINLDEVDLDDPAIINGLNKNVFLDGNAGLNYFNKGFNMGLSLPKIFKSKAISEDEFDPGEISPLNDAILMTSYKWEISEKKFALEPHVIYYYSKDFPGQFEAIGLAHLMDVFWIGASFRQYYGTTGFIGLNMKDNFKFGYAYEFFNVQPVNFNNGTHDIQLSIVFGKKKKKGKINLIQKRRNMLRAMGKLPSQKKQSTYQVENDPFVPTETYSEEDALQDLLNEENTKLEVEEESVIFEEMESQVEKDTIDIFNFEFDDEVPAQPNKSSVVVPTLPVKTDKIEEPVIVEELESLVEEDTIDIFNFKFDDELDSKPNKSVVIASGQLVEQKKIDEEAVLIKQMEEEAMDEFTINDQNEIKEVNEAKLTFKFEEDAVEQEEYTEPTLDDEGAYIGPTTVIKGNHLLELDKGNYVVVGTLKSYRDAEEHSDALFMKGFYTKFGYISQTKIYYVYIFENEDLQEAKDTSERFNLIGARLSENWVLQVK